MNSLFLYFLEFLFAYIFVILFYKIFVFRKFKKEFKNKKKIDSKKLESLFVEVRLFRVLTKIDTKGIEERLMNVLMYVNAFDVAILLLITELVDNGILKALVALIVVFPILCFSYKLVGSYIKKKGER